MIATLVRIAATNLARDRAAQIMTFVLPVAFFTIFALVFGGRGGNGTPQVRLAVVDEDTSATSRRLVRGLEDEGSLRVVTRGRASSARGDTATVPLDRAAARALVRGGDVPAALIVPAGIDTSLGRYDGAGARFLLYTDPSDPIARQMVSGLLQKVVMSAAPDAFVDRGMRALDDFGGGLTDAQRIAMGDLKADMAARAESRLDPAGPGDSTVGDAAGLSGMAPIEVEPVLGRKQDRSLISFYAAGIAVMFLLFSASGGAGALLDEVDSGTLERVLGTRVGMTGLLAGKWLWLTLLGTLQIVVMFLYAALAFRLDLLPHLVGFAIMTPLTAATCAAFGLVLATACRTRAQLSGISTLVILLISALGGSMWPRFLMSDWMQRAGQVLFNAWALEGYRQVFWRDAGPADLLPHVAFLVASTAGFLLLARLLARRWEHA